MPYYPSKKILFIHIPKTGGTVIEYEIKRRCIQTLYSGPTNNLLESPYDSKSLQHQFYNTLYKYRHKLELDFDNIKIFTVVRNPYDRTISALFWANIINAHYTAEQVFDAIQNRFIDRTDLDNHNEPQYKFITDENQVLIPSIKILKCETLNQTNTELNDYIGININIRRPNVNKDYSKYLNRDSISLINEYYKKDFELFNYAKISLPTEE